MCLNKKWEIEIIRQGRIENSSERKTSDVELLEKMVKNREDEKKSQKLWNII